MGSDERCEMIIFESLLPLLKKASFLEATGAVVKIGSCLKTLLPLTSLTKLRPNSHETQYCDKNIKRYCNKNIFLSHGFQ